MPKKILAVEIIALCTVINLSCDKLFNFKNEPPICRITTPQNGAQIKQGTNVIIAAKVDDEDGKIDEVRFSIDGIEIHTAYSFPYYYCWNTSGVEIDTHTVKISVKDDDSAEITKEVEVIIIANLLGMGTVTDIDSNIYHTVTLGNQVWITENLRVTRYNNGDTLVYAIDPNDWTNREWGIEGGAYCEYSSDTVAHGYLYNVYAVDDERKLAPAGWHIPTYTEWQTLIEFLGGVDIAGGVMKETGVLQWRYPNSGATNESGLSVLPSGRRLYDGSYDGYAYRAYFWSSSESKNGDQWYCMLYYSSSHIVLNDYDIRYGHSIRCIKDD